MSEAENKWEDFDDNNRYHLDYPKTKPEVSRDSREAYKAALRESIEGVRQKAFSTNGYFHNGMVASDDFIHGWMAARNEFLKLLDTVEP